MSYRHVALAQTLFDSCLFDEALTDIEKGLGSDPIELPNIKELSLLTTLSLYPLSHVGSKNVTTLVYNSMHGGQCDVQNTPGRRAINVLRWLQAYSTGEGEGPQRVSELFRLSLCDIEATRSGKSRVGVAGEDYDCDPGQIPLAGLSMGEHVSRDLVATDAEGGRSKELKEESEKLHHLWTYTNVSSSWLSLWSFYGYYLHCSMALTAPHMSAWYMAKPLLDVILSVLEQDVHILDTFVGSGALSNLDDILERLFPDAGTSFAPLFHNELQFGPQKLDEDVLLGIRETAFMESMYIRKNLVRLLLRLHWNKKQEDAEKRILSRFTDFVAEHPQVISSIYTVNSDGCAQDGIGSVEQPLPPQFAIWMLQVYLPRCRGDSKSLGLTQFYKRGGWDELAAELLELVSETLSRVPSQKIVHRVRGSHRTEYLQVVLYAFYAHAKFWLKLLFSSPVEYELDELLENAQKGCELRMDALEEEQRVEETFKLKSGKKDRLMCQEQEDYLQGMIRLRQMMHGM